MPKIPTIQPSRLPGGVANPREKRTSRADGVGDIGQGVVQVGKATAEVFALREKAAQRDGEAVVQSTLGKVQRKVNDDLYSESGFLNQYGDEGIDPTDVHVGWDRYVEELSKEIPESFREDFVARASRVVEPARVKSYKHSSSVAQQRRVDTYKGAVAQAAANNGTLAPEESLDDHIHGVHATNYGAIESVFLLARELDRDTGPFPVDATHNERIVAAAMLNMDDYTPEMRAMIIEGMTPAHAAAAEGLIANGELAAAKAYLETDGPTHQMDSKVRNRLLAAITEARREQSIQAHVDTGFGKSTRAAGGITVFDNDSMTAFLSTVPESMRGEVLAGLSAAARSHEKNVVKPRVMALGTGLTEGLFTGAKFYTGKRDKDGKPIPNSEWQQLNELDPKYARSIAWAYDRRNRRAQQDLEKRTREEERTLKRHRDNQRHLLEKAMFEEVDRDPSSFYRMSQPERERWLLGVAHHNELDVSPEDISKTVIKSTKMKEQATRRGVEGSLVSHTDAKRAVRSWWASEHGDRKPNRMEQKALAKAEEDLRLEIDKRREEHVEFPPETAEEYIRASVERVPTRDSSIFSRKRPRIIAAEETESVTPPTFLEPDSTEPRDPEEVKIRKDDLRRTRKAEKGDVPFTAPPRKKEEEAGEEVSDEESIQAQLDLYRELNGKDPSPAEMTRLLTTGELF